LRARRRKAKILSGVSQMIASFMIQTIGKRSCASRLILIFLSVQEACQNEKQINKYEIDLTRGVSIGCLPYGGRAWPGCCKNILLIKMQNHLDGTSIQMRRPLHAQKCY
jgi:hypothetical protein